MREFAKVSPQFWISGRGKEIKSLGIAAQLIAFYLSTNPHASMIGVYYLPIAFISHETGIEFDEVVKSLEKLSDINFCSYDSKSEYIWVHDMAFDQLGSGLKEADNRIKGFKDAFEALPKLPFLQAFVDKYAKSFYMESKIEILTNTLEAPFNPPHSNENNNNNKKEINNEKIKNNIINFINDDDEFNFERLNVDEQAIKIIQFFNKKMDTSYLADEENVKLISTHLKSGITPQQCCYVITNKHRYWGKNDVMKEFLKLEIIFGKKFNKYVAELRKPKLKNIA